MSKKHEEDVVLHCVYFVDEHVCPGYDVCPVKLCGCRWIGLGTPFASDVKKPDLPNPPDEG